jgi:signal transduction histidine kinase
VTELAASMSVPVGIDVTVDRLPGAVEATACFVIAEALMNLVKHPRASRAAVTAAVAGRTLRLHVRDDGVGGAQADGSGLVGLSDRLAALGGRLRVDSPAGGGTLIAASIPATDPRPADVPVPRAPDRGDEDAGEGRTGA